LRKPSQKSHAAHQQKKRRQLRPAAAPYSEHNQQAPWLSNADCWCAQEFGLSDENTQSGWRMIV